MMDDELEELREQTDPGNRADDTGRPEFGEAMEAALVAISRGDRSKTLSVRDEHVAAVIYALEEIGEDDAVGERLAEAANRDERDVDRSEVLRSALRVGLEDVAPELMEQARETHGEFVRGSL